MRENQWTDTIKTLINDSNLENKLFADTLVKMPYSNEIISHNAEFQDEDLRTNCFETDLLIYEKKDELIKPRVIIESKINSVTAHDSITYSYKAQQHKSVTPYIRYGIMIGNRKHHPLPGRLYRHGTNFDFMIQFQSFELTEEEKEVFLDLLVKEVKYSKQLEEFIYSSRSRSRKPYYVLQKNLRLEEM